MLEFFLGYKTTFKKRFISKIRATVLETVCVWRSLREELPLCKIRSCLFQWSFVYQKIILWLGINFDTYEPNRERRSILSEEIKVCLMSCCIRNTRRFINNLSQLVGDGEVAVHDFFVDFVQVDQPLVNTEVTIQIWKLAEGSPVRILSIALAIWLNISSIIQWRVKMKWHCKQVPHTRYGRSGSLLMGILPHGNPTLI